MPRNVRIRAQFGPEGRQSSHLTKYSPRLTPRETSLLTNAQVGLVGGNRIAADGSVVPGKDCSSCVVSAMTTPLPHGARVPVHRSRLCGGFVGRGDLGRCRRGIPPRPSLLQHHHTSAVRLRVMERRVFSMLASPLPGTGLRPWWCSSRRHRGTGFVDRHSQFLPGSRGCSRKRRYLTIAGRRH
jgi:hypothetical protein